MPAREPVDVLICTLDRGVAAARVAEAVLPQLAPDDGLLILDQSVDGWALRAAVARLGDPRCHVRQAPARGLPAARNHALSITSRPLVIFFDDDVEVAPGCVDAHRAALADPGVAGTVGRTVEPTLRWNARPGTNRVGLGGRVRMHLEGEVARDVRGLKGCNMGLRRSAIEHVGGFDEGFVGTAFLEEADLAARLRRAGSRIRYVPDAAVLHRADPTGGVRQGGAMATEIWRFANTGRYLMRHRGMAGLLAAFPTFVAIAAKRAVQWRSPLAAVRLPRRFVGGALQARGEGVIRRGRRSARGRSAPPGSGRG